MCLSPVAAARAFSTDLHLTSGRKKAIRASRIIGVTLVVDPMSVQYLMGAEIDYKEDLQGAQFRHSQPERDDDLRLRLVIFRLDGTAH